MINVIDLFNNVVRAFNQDKRRFLITVLDILKVNPIIIFQAIVFLRFPSISSAAMILLGGVASLLVVNVKHMLKLANDTGKIITGCLDELNKEGVSGRTYKIQQLFPGFFGNHNEIIEDIEKWLIQLNRIWDVKLDQMVKIHVAPGTALYTCYTNTQLFESHIFISNIPEEEDSMQKFFILHEIGHAIVRVITKPVDLVAGLTPYFFYIFWLMLSLKWTIDAFTITTACALATIVWRREYKQRIKSSLLLDEILADCLAIGYLSKKDIQKISQNKKFYSMLDSKMSSLHNSIRLAKRKENIELALKGEDEKAFESIVTGYLPESSLVSLFTAASLISLPAVYAINPSGSTMVLSGVIDLVLVLLFLTSSLYYSIMNHVLEKKLNIQFPEASEAG